MDRDQIEGPRSDELEDAHEELATELERQLAPALGGWANGPSSDATHRTTGQQ